MRNLIPIGEAFRRLGVDRVTLRRWEKEGLVKPYRDHRGYRFYTEEDLQRLAQWRKPRQMENKEEKRD